MDPTAILGAIRAADLAIDAAAKVKKHFFSSNTGDKTNSSKDEKVSVTLDTIQVEVDLLKKQLAEVADEVADNRAIIQEQNEIIIGLSNALKTTAETAQRLRMLTLSAVALSVASIFAALYALFR